MAGNLIFLGILAAPTSKGRRAVAVSMTGAAELYHIVDAGFRPGTPEIESWLISAGIEPNECYAAMSADDMVEHILIPEIGNKTLVVSHSDIDTHLVDLLVSKLGRMANPAIISGIDLSGPIAASVNGAAGRRAFALQATYENALEEAKTNPPQHIIDGEMDGSKLKSISVSGPFAKNKWELDSEEDALFIMMTLVGMMDFCKFVVRKGPAASTLEGLVAKVGIRQLAA